MYLVERLSGTSYKLVSGIFVTCWFDFITSNLIVASAAAQTQRGCSFSRVAFRFLILIDLIITQADFYTDTLVENIRQFKKIILWKNSNELQKIFSPLCLGMVVVYLKHSHFNAHSVWLTLYLIFFQRIMNVLETHKNITFTINWVSVIRYRIGTYT